MARKKNEDEYDLLEDEKHRKKVEGDPNYGLAILQRVPLRFGRPSPRTSASREKFLRITGEVDLGGNTKLSNIVIRFVQTGERSITAYCQLRMRSSSRYSIHAPSPLDISMYVETKDSARFQLTNVPLSSISRQCGDHSLSTVHESQNHPVNAVDLMAFGILHFSYYNRVKWC